MRTVAVLAVTCISFVAPALAAPTIYPAPDGAPRGSKYSVGVNGKAAFVYDARIESIHRQDPRNCNYASFDLPQGETAEISVTVPDGFKSARVLPESAKISPAASGKSITFSVSKPQHLTVTLDGSYRDPLFIFVNPIEVDPPKQGAPGVHYYGPGTHQVGEVELGSNETVYIAGGAIVKGTFSSSNASNITIRGRGILDCHDNSKSLMQFRDSKHITLEGFIAVDHPQMKWAITFRSCDDVTVDNIKQMHGDHWSCDALNLVSSQHCRISNCFLKAQDDCICVKAMGSSRREVKDIAVTNCFIWSTWAHGIQVGAELDASSVSDITFKNIDIVHLPAMVEVWGWCKTFDYYGALGIYNSDNAVVSNVRFEDIRVELGNRCPRLLNLRIGRSNWATTPDRGWIRDIYFKDIHLINEQGKGWDGYIHGFDDRHLVENVTFENLTILGKTITNAADARFDTAFVKNVQFVRGQNTEPAIRLSGAGVSRLQPEFARDQGFDVQLGRAPLESKSDEIP